MKVEKIRSQGAYPQSCRVGQRTPQRCRLDFVYRGGVLFTLPGFGRIFIPNPCLSRFHSFFQQGRIVPQENYFPEGVFLHPANDFFSRWPDDAPRLQSRQTIPMDADKLFDHQGWDEGRMAKSSGRFKSDPILLVLSSADWVDRLWASWHGRMPRMHPGDIP